ncbi:hypothetical protein TIFTF001_011514 [Ficus carica]|uniref:Bulb-type lectin domain-containing protein n=1 Tax=Ficus carica TaxID=3494 RepID=A0AA88D5G4_FICCA|nr:hypothetical protein TIFTF001_011514 [Ficus carica]
MAVQPVLERLVVVVVVVALILISFDIKAKANGQFSNLSVGNFLSPEADVTSWLSPSGVFAFGFYRQIYGFAVGIWMNNEDKKTVVWTAIRDGPPISSDATLKLTEEGLFLFQTENNNQTLISSSPRYPGKVSSAAMLDSGNFVLNGNDLGVIWESLDFPTDTILGGQTLFSNSPLVSSSSPSNHSSGRYLLIMQGDGNLVSYAIHGSRYREEDSYWSTSTWGTQFSMLCLNETGSLFLKDDEDRVWIVANGSSFSTTARSINNSEIIIYRATLDHDANFRLYSHQIYNHKSRMLLLWQAVDNQRGVLSKGSCGLNSYYVVDGSSSYCSCYPGFAFINPKNRREGCFQQYIEDSCMDQDEDQGTRYNMSTPLENTIWDDRPYLVVQLPEKDACSKSCLEDCNCKAVFVVVYKYRDHRYKKMLENAILGLDEDFGLQSFSYDELEKATDGFKEELGRSTFGAVYKGTLSRNRRAIAVKRL